MTKTGAIVSTTWIFCLIVVVFKQASVNTQVLIIVKVSPGHPVPVVVEVSTPANCPEQLSVAVNDGAGCAEVSATQANNTSKGAASFKTGIIVSFT